MKSIGVSEEVKNGLDALKDRNGHTSLDSLLRSLISTPCKGTSCVWYWNCVEFGCSTFKEKIKEIKE